MNLLVHLDRALRKRTPRLSVGPEGTNVARQVTHHSIEESEPTHQFSPNFDTEEFLYEALWQGLIRPGLWHIDSLSWSEELEIRGWAIRPECWFGEATFTVNGRPFTTVERDGDRPDVVSALKVGKNRVSGFRCRIDLKDLPEGVKDLQFAYADRRTLAPLAA